jgi:hypothetical protein
MLTDADQNTIYAMIERAIPADTIVYGKVISRDERKGLIKLKEFGDQWIPLVGFRGTAKIHDDNGTNVKVKTVKITPEVPKIGETVVVLRQFGTRRLPKCVGVILSTGNYVS